MGSAAPNRAERTHPVTWSAESPERDAGTGWAEDGYRSLAE